MEKTKNYEKFKFLSLNRNLNRRCINALKNSITKNGYIGNPILVNDDYEILDGQHRFAALKEMGMDVPYQVVEKSYDTIIDLNTTQHNWSMEDYVNFYCEKDHNQHYIRLKRLCKELNNSISNILIMAFGHQFGGQETLNFKKGIFRFTIDDELKVKTFYGNYEAVVKEMRIRPTTRLLRALMTIQQRPNFKWKTLFNKSKAHPTMAYNCRTVDEYISMVRDLYNYCTKSENQRI